MEEETASKERKRMEKGRIKQGFAHTRHSDDRSLDLVESPDTTLRGRIPIDNP